MTEDESLETGGFEWAWGLPWNDRYLEMKWAKSSTIVTLTSLWVSLFNDNEAIGL